MHYYYCEYSYDHSYSDSIYFMFTGLAWIIAAYGAIMQISETIECPKTEEGIPMCYISFVMFSLLILLKAKELTKMYRKKTCDEISK